MQTSLPQEDLSLQPLVRYRRIFHPSDFSPASLVAFHHALRLAIAFRCELDILHVAASTTGSWGEFPGVRDTLARWGSLPGGSSLGDLGDLEALGVRVRKVQAHGDDPADVIVGYLQDHAMDMVVLSTHQRRGLDRWLHRAVAEPVARQSHVPTLFIPCEVPGFVGASDGALRLESVLLPVDREPHPRPALAAARILARGLRVPSPRFLLLHVGDPEEAPSIGVEARPGEAWEWEHRRGPVVEMILEAGRDQEADLMVLTTQGRKGMLEALVGSTTERIVREAPCPVLAVPAGGSSSDR